MPLDFLPASAILSRLLATYPGLRQVSSWGEQALFYNPDGLRPRGIYFATIKEKDGAHDTASRLSRPGVYRLNLGLGKATYPRRFGPPPRRPAKGRTVALACDFTRLDTVMPHPVYAWMCWICVLCPSEATFASLQPLLAEAYALVQAKHRRPAPARPPSGSSCP